MIPLARIDRFRLLSIASREIARGQEIIGEARMRVATVLSQRSGAFSAEDRLVAFDDHGWILRGNGRVVSSFILLEPDMLVALGWPVNSLRIIAHQRVCDQVLGGGLLGDLVLDDEPLEDALRRVIRSGIEIMPPRGGTTRFAGPFEVRRESGGCPTYTPVTVVCDVAPGLHGNIVRSVQVIGEPFDATRHRFLVPGETLDRVFAVPDAGLEIPDGEATYRVHLGTLPNRLRQRAGGMAPEWWASQVIASGAWRRLNEDGVRRFFRDDQQPAETDDDVVGFAFDFRPALLLERGSRSLAVLARVGPSRSGQVVRYATIPFSTSVLTAIGLLA